jgi:CBS-domain-containing membrane protein
MTDPPASAPDAVPSQSSLAAALRRVPPSVYGGAVMAVIGALGWACAVPWLFPSLGPTIAIQSEVPDHHSARPWNVVVGHLIGAAVGFAAVRITGVIHQQPVNVSHALNGARVLAAALAVFASMALQTLVRARHAPAQATTLLIVVGALDADLHGAFVLAAGIALVATLGEGVRRLKLPR